MQDQVININEKLSELKELWSPKVIGEIHDFQFKVVKIAGDFIWHEHQGADKVFFVLEGEMFIVPGDAEQKSFAERECHIMLVEPWVE